MWEVGRILRQASVLDYPFTVKKANAGRFHVRASWNPPFEPDRSGVNLSNLAQPGGSLLSDFASRRRAGYRNSSPNIRCLQEVATMRRELSAETIDYAYIHLALFRLVGRGRRATAKDGVTINTLARGGVCR